MTAGSIVGALSATCRWFGGFATRPALLGGIALLIYVLAAAAIFGRDVLLSPGDRVVGDLGADKTIFMWSFRWWPYAILHGHDPFDANVVWVPHGIDLSWVTSVPLISFVLAPLTAAAGPVATYNVAVLAAPALSAWAAYLLARWLTRAFWPSLVAGWLFGFSAFEIGQMVSHLFLVLTIFVPLCALLVLRHLHGEITDRRFVVLLALVLVGQFLTSAEVFVTLLIVGAIFGGTLALLNPGMRGRVRATVRCSALGTTACLLLMSPYLWHAFVIAGTENAPLRSAYSESADVLNYVVPTRLIWLQLPGSTDIASRFTATGAERGAYLGLPLLAIVAFFLTGIRRSRPSRVVALGLAATVIASLGASIRVAGHGLLPGPWKVFAALPVTRAILPVRLTLYVVLVVSMIAAVWLADRDGSRRRWRWTLIIVAMVFLLPNPASKRWSSEVPNPAFFRTAVSTKHLHEGETALVLPYSGSGWSLLWQAEEGFRYRLVGGHFGHLVPEERRWEPVYHTLSWGPSSPRSVRALRRFLRAHDVNAIVVGPDTRWQPRRLVAALGIKPVHTADVLIYRLR